MANSETTLIRVEIEAKDRLFAAGAEIAHNPNVGANDALLAVLGELTQLQKRVKELEKALTRPTPTAA